MQFQVNPTLPLACPACSACSGQERARRLSGGEAQPVIGRRGSHAAAAGRTVPVTSAAFFDCFLLFLHFRVFSSTAQCQTPSHCPSPACHSYSGRWRWQPGAAPEGRWEEPREGEVLGQGDRARTQLHRTWGRLSLRPACSWSPKIRNSPTSRTSSASGHLCHAHHPYQNTRALRAVICICPVHCCIPSA